MPPQFDRCNNAAANYGALQSDGGRLDVSWVGGSDLCLELREHPDHELTPPERFGTGLSLVRGLIEYELDGSAQLDFLPTGLFCSLTIPLAEGAASSPPTETVVHL